MPGLGTLAPVADPPPATWSGFGNGSFRVWPQGVGPHVITPGQQRYVAGLWRVVAGHDAVVGPTVTVRQADPEEGGVYLEVSFTAADQVVYLRTLSYDLDRFAGELFTPTFRVQSPDPLLLDYYARARWNADDNQRLLVADTDRLALPPGDTIVACLDAAVPRLDDPLAAGWPLTERSGLESALRVWSDGPGIKRLTVTDAAMPAGISPGLPAMAGPDDDRAAVFAFEQGDYHEEMGMPDVKGQKRTRIRWAEKALPIARGHIRITDLNGVPGTVSTYDRDGNRTNGVPIYAVGAAPSGGYQTGCQVILRDSYAAGIGCLWYVRNYGEGEWSTW